MPKQTTEPKIELQPDAWERFERAVKVVAKAPPQHRTKKKQVRKGGERAKAKRTTERR